MCRPSKSSFRDDSLGGVGLSIYEIFSTYSIFACITTQHLCSVVGGDRVATANRIASQLNHDPQVEDGESSEELVTIRSRSERHPLTHPLPVGRRNGTWNGLMDLALSSGNPYLAEKNYSSCSNLQDPPDTPGEKRCRGHDILPTFNGGASRR